MFEVRKRRLYNELYIQIVYFHAFFISFMKQYSAFVFSERQRHTFCSLMIFYVR